MKEFKCKYPQKIVVIDSKENPRQGGARNLGIKAATADYIGFVDSDDWIAPNMFEQLYNKAIEKMLI
ncbi:glycosyltransferase [Paenibacillus dendritiformis]|nr:glycosyltransferase [Paenibacillus dendritiformis]